MNLTFFNLYFYIIFPPHFPPPPSISTFFECSKQQPTKVYYSKDKFWNRSQNINVHSVSYNWGSENPLSEGVAVLEAGSSAAWAWGQLWGVAWATVATLPVTSPVHISGMCWCFSHGAPNCWLLFQEEQIFWGWHNDVHVFDTKTRTWSQPEIKVSTQLPGGLRSRSPSSEPSPLSFSPAFPFLINSFCVCVSAWGCYFYIFYIHWYFKNAFFLSYLILVIGFVIVWKIILPLSLLFLSLEFCEGLCGLHWPRTCNPPWPLHPFC